MGRPKLIDKPVRISMVISSDLYDKIRKRANELSINEKNLVTVSELTRRTMENLFQDDGLSFERARDKYLK